MIDILLVAPQDPSTTGIVSKAYGITPPLGIAGIASYLRQHGLQVSILDNNILRYTIAEFKDHLRRLRPRYVGFSLLTFTVNIIYDLASAVKDFDEKIVTFAGGAHATVLSEQVLRESRIDIVVRGEGEETSRDLIRALASGSSIQNIAGISFRKDRLIIKNPDRALISDLNVLPLPAYDLLPMDKYFLSATRRLSRGKAGSIMTSRGCPYRCAFCSRAVFGQSVRFRSPESVIREIVHLRDNYKISELVLWDDTFTVDRNRAVAICRLIKQRAPGLIWSCYSRPDHFSDALYAALKEGGCRQVSFGIESGVQKILDGVKKDMDVRVVEKAVEGCRRHRMLSFCSFILGLPGETKKTIFETIRFAKKINPDFVAFCSLIPLPGSEIFDSAVKKGLIDPGQARWEEYVNLLSTNPPPVQLGEVTKNELVLFQKIAYRRFYFRLSYFLKTLLRIRSTLFLAQVWRGFMALWLFQTQRAPRPKHGTTA